MDAVAFLINLVNLEKDRPMPRYPYCGVPEFQVIRVCTEPVREPWWAGWPWEWLWRDERRYRRSVRRAPLLVGYDAAEINLLPRGSRDENVRRRSDWWTGLDFPSVPLTSMFAYQATQMRSANRPLGGRASVLDCCGHVRSRV